MKQHRLILLIGALLLLPIQLRAEKIVVDSIQYQLIGNSAYYAVGYIDGITDVIIPSSVNGYPVREIIDSAFYYCSTIKTIVISDAVEKIGSAAFMGCINLSSVQLPSKITNLPFFAFCDCSSLTSITIPNSVTNIGYYAFSGCSSLTSVSLPNGHVYIGGWAFQDCTSLVSIELPDYMEFIDQYSFSGCSNLSSITIPDGVTAIYDNAFSRCTSICSIHIPNSVTYIGAEAFDECIGLTSVVIPNSVTRVGSSLFRNCSNLISVSIPDNWTTIEYGTFEGCSSLTSILIPNGVTSIGVNAFYGCSSLTSILLPDGITRIGFGAFSNCIDLTTITIPNCVTYIEDRLFSGCKNLQSVVIPNNVNSIGVESFSGCVNLSSIYLPESVNYMGEFVFSGCKSLTSINIPSGIDEIPYRTFDECSALTTVIIPDGVRGIGNAAFYNCSGLKSVSLPDGLIEIGNSAFEGCSGLSDIYIPNSVNIIKDYAFRYCDGLTTLSFPSSLSNISSAAFYFKIGHLKAVYLRGGDIADYEVYNNSAFSSVQFFVDEGLYDQYSTAPGWKKISKRIYGPEMMPLRTINVTADESHSAIFTVLNDSAKYIANLKVKGSINGYDIMALRNKTSHLLYLDLSDANIVANDGGYEYYTGCYLTSDNELGDNSFMGTNLISISLPKSLKTIGENAFSDCPYLESVVCYEGMETIKKAAFYNCQYLKQINLPQSLITLGSMQDMEKGMYDYYPDKGVFQNCSSLGPILDIPDKVTTITSYCFYRCVSLDSVHIGNKVRGICLGSFQGCDNLRKVSFNKNLSLIGQEAFSNCLNLRAISLPYSVSRIYDNAFAYCKSLNSIKIPSMTKQIGDKAFYGCDNVENVYTYTVEPVQIDQNTFSYTTTAILNVPKTSAELYEYNTQWSQFQIVHEFDEPYDAFYLMGDYELNDYTGRLDGEPDAELNSTSGFIVQGNETQQLNDIELIHDGTNGGTIIGGADDLTGNQANITAKSMKVNISVDGNRWYFFCFPFDVEHDSIECSGDYMFYSYDGTRRADMGAGWVQVEQDFQKLQKGVGYVFQTGRAGILTIHVGADYLSFASNSEKEALSIYESGDASNAHWNFMGNPFISYYDIQDLADEYDAPIVVWNGSSYDAYKPGDDDYQLKPFEAFFVQKEAGASYVEFLPENRLTYNQAAAVSSLRARRRTEMGTPMSLDRQLVNIVLTGQDSISDRTRIVYNTDASIEYEIGVDAAKFHTDGIPEIYTVNGTTKYAINERPMGTDDIKLGFIAPKSGNYTLSVPRMDADVQIYDNETHHTVDFTFGAYSFQTQAGTFNDRFVIHKTSDGVTVIDNGFCMDGMTVTVFDGGIDIDGQLKSRVQIYSDSGMLMAEPLQAGRVQLESGVYIIKIGDRSIKLNVNRGGNAI